MAFAAVYDACVLFPIALRDLLIRLALTGLFRAKWTEQILGELAGALAEKYPDVAPQLDRQLELMRQAIPDVDVRNYARLIPIVPALPDPDDAHVVAAAMASGAEVIVTFNLARFPPEALGALDIEAQHPDVFVRHLVDLDRSAVESVVEQMARARTKPPVTYDALLDLIAVRGLPESSAALRRPGR